MRPKPPQKPTFITPYARWADRCVNLFFLGFLIGFVALLLGLLPIMFLAGALCAMALIVVFLVLPAVFIFSVLLKSRYSVRTLVLIILSVGLLIGLFAKDERLLATLWGLVLFVTVIIYVSWNIPAE